MSDGIMLVFGEDGVAREYDDTWDITIHCESEEEQKAVWEKLNNLNREVKNLTDTISRQAAIDAISTPHGILYPIRTIEELPSAQQWIPVTERLPEDGKMSDYISRQIAINAILAQSTHDSVRELYEYTQEHPTAHWTKGLCDAIDAVIAVDGAPSTQPERPKGKWITQEFGSWAECSECHELYDIPIACSNFCPNCGADMRGEQE